MCPSGAELVAYFRERLAKDPAHYSGMGPDRWLAVIAYVDGLVAAREVAEAHVKQLQDNLAWSGEELNAERRRHLHEMSEVRDQLHAANRRLLELIEVRP